MTSAMTPIVSNGRCVGFLLRRGREGIEAFDADERSLGIFNDPISAANAVQRSAVSALRSEGK
jgi:hypothetical protein